MAWDLLRCSMNNLRKFLCKYGTSKSLIVHRRRQQRSISMSNDLLRIKKVFNKPIFQWICIQYWLPHLEKLDIGITYYNIYMSKQINFPMDVHNASTPTLEKIGYWNEVLWHLHVSIHYLFIAPSSRTPTCCLMQL